MHLSRRIRLQLAIFGVVTLLAGGLMAFGYLRLPGLLFESGITRSLSVCTKRQDFTETPTSPIGVLKRVGSKTSA